MAGSRLQNCGAAVCRLFENMKTLSLKITFLDFCEFMCGRGGLMRFGELIFHFHYGGLGDGTQVVRLGGKCLYPLGRLSGPYMYFSSPFDKNTAFVV